MGVTTKKISIMASYDWSMRAAMYQFVAFADPVIRHRGNQFKLELSRIVARPLRAGADLRGDADLLVDRTIHWNDYYKFYAQQAINCQMRVANHSNTFQNHDKHSTYDLITRVLHPKDRLPVTVLLPQYRPYTEDQKRQELWELEQRLILKHTKHGWDDARREIDWRKVEEEMRRALQFRRFNELMYDHFYCKGNYLEEAVNEHFGGRFPLYLKKAFGGGGSHVYKVKNFEELYRRYDETGGRSFHLQEAIEGYDTFVRCMAIGPQILPMRFQPDEPLHEHYSAEKLRLPADIGERLFHYVSFINAYHRWTYNSFEALVKDGAIHPIDFANACPDSNFTSLHVHFPWVICALVKWFSFVAVTGRDLRIDMEQNRYLDVLNDPRVPQEKKYEHAAKLSAEYFDRAKFDAFCDENFADLEEKMIRFYDAHFDEIIAFSIEHSDFPEHEREKFFHHYKDRMDNVFRPNARDYLTAVLPA